MLCETTENYSIAVVYISTLYIA